MSLSLVNNYPLKCWDCLYLLNWAGGFNLLNKRLKSKLQILQNKCIRFCLNLNNRAHIGQKEFEKINWLPINDRFKQIISSMSFKFCNNTSPPYMNDVFKPASQPNTTTRASLLKLNQLCEELITIRIIFSI